VAHCFDGAAIRRLNRQSDGLLSFGLRIFITPALGAAVGIERRRPATRFR
jgi:hypothetical protein